MRAPRAGTPLELGPLASPALLSFEFGMARKRQKTRKSRVQEVYQSSVTPLFRSTKAPKTAQILLASSMPEKRTNPAILWSFLLPPTPPKAQKNQPSALAQTSSEGIFGLELWVFTPSLYLEGDKKMGIFCQA